MKVRRRLRLRRSKYSDGAALVSVLCLLGLLTVMALGALSATRRHAQLARTSFQLVQQRELADSALRLSILELAAPERETNIPALGQRNLALFGQTLAVEVWREAGRIDLNYASESLLVAAFAGNNIDEQEARSLAARIIDWRDPDDSRSVQGAERSEYRLANRIGPRNGAFENVSELMQVLGAERLPESMLEMFTVYSHSNTVRQDAAAPAVMNALHWAQAHQLEGRSWLDESPATGGEAQRSLAGEVLRLRACTATQPLATCRTTVVRLTGDRANPALVFTWQ